ncbi:MAG: hypothetical protein ACFFAN_19705 [Promethearchaeota archaeon]
MIFGNSIDIIFVIRYHSLAVKGEIIVQVLKISAYTEDGHIKGVRHKKYPVEGIQFHHESIKKKPHVTEILKNFLGL